MKIIEIDRLFQASGSLGAPVLKALVKSGKFNVTVVKRATSSAEFPESVTVRTADLASVESVATAFEGQDAVVSTVGTTGIPGQTILVEAAAIANVKRFLPSDFGSDLANPKAAAMPIFKFKIATHKALREAAADKSDFTWTSVVNSAFLDWGLEKGFLLNWKDSKPKLYDGGEHQFSATTLASVGQAVVGVLSNPQETKNRFVYIKDIDISQNQLLEIVKKIDPETNREEPTILDTAELEKSSYESLAKGQVTPPVMMAFLFRIIFGPPEYGGRLSKTDNELLGVKGKTLADVEALIKSMV